MRHAMFVAAIALALIGLGCAQIPGQQAVATAAAPAANSGGQSVTIPGGNGQNVTISSTVPDALKGFPVPDGFTLDKDGYGSVSSKDGVLAVGSWSGTVTSSQAVFDFYSKTMTQQGWTEQMTSKTDSGGLSTYTKGDSQATVTINTTEKPAKIAVMVGRFVATPTVSSSASTSDEASPTPNAAQASSAQPVATETTAPPNLSATGAVPAELSSVPVPSGFKVIADSGQTMSAGGKLSMATVSWFGTTSLADVGSFYKQAMAADWTEESTVQADQGSVASYTSKKDPKNHLSITASKTDAGTEVAAMLIVSP